MGIVNFVAKMERMQAKARARFAFSEFLGSCSRRCTPERLAVLDAALDRTEPFGAEDLIEDLQRQSAVPVSRATVFNTLPLLLRAGLLRRVFLGSESLYESLRPGKAIKPAVYLVCSVCGKTRRIDSAGFGQWAAVLTPRGFQVEPNASSAYLSGRCTQCKSSATKEKVKPLITKTKSK